MSPQPRNGRGRPSTLPLDEATFANEVHPVSPPLNEGPDRLRRVSLVGTVVLSLVAGGALLADGDRTAGGCLCAAQAAALVWLFAESYDDEHGWATAGCVTATAWALIFLAPSVIYVADTDLIEPSQATQAIAVVNLSLFALLVGQFFARRFLALPADTQTVLVRAGRLSRSRIAIFVAVGFLGLAILFAANGGPVSWLENLDKTGAMAEGLTYVIFLALGIKFAVVVAVCNRWASGGTLDWRLGLSLVTAMALVSLLGARAFIAFTLAELLLVHALIKRPVPLRIIFPVGIAVGAVLIFGFGTFKRYQTFQASNPDIQQGFVDYATGTAVDELSVAYANNYADGVRHIATARRIVPEEAGYEYGKALVRLTLQPIPSPVRPEVATEGPLRRAFDAPGGNSYAIPLQAVSYIQLGLGGVAIASLLMGVLVGRLDQWLVRGSASLPAMLAVVAAAVQVPFVLRTGIPRGLAISALEVFGLWFVARTVLLQRRDVGN